MIIAIIGTYLILALLFGFIPCHFHMSACPEGLEALRWITNAVTVGAPLGIIMGIAAIKKLLLTDIYSS